MAEAQRRRRSDTASRREFMTAAGKGRRRPRRSLGRLSGDRAGLGVRRDRAEQPHQRRRDRHRAASRAATTCRGSGSTTPRGSWPSATSTASASQDAKTLVNGYYTKKTGKPYDGVTALRRLPRAARQQGRRRRRHQHAGSLARAHRDPRGRGRQGRLPAEAGVADDRRGPRAQQRRAPLGPHLPDRQPAALVAAVPLRRRARAQRAHRPAEDRGGRAARRSVRRGRAGRCRCRRT